MEIIVKQGRYLFAISIAAFGIENLICAHSSDPFLPVIPWVRLLVAGVLYGVASLRQVCVSRLRSERGSRRSCWASFFLLCDLVLQIPRVAALPWDVGARTCAFETLTMCASALILAEPYRRRARFWRWEGAVKVLTRSGRYLSQFQRSSSNRSLSRLQIHSQPGTEVDSGRGLVLGASHCHRIYRGG